MSSAISRSTPTPHEGEERTFFGQPWALANLSGVEMWERFSFYGLQALLAYYLYYSVSDGGLGLSQSAALSIVGAYGGLVYLTSVAGAWVADRVLSAERTLFYSAILIMIGHISLAVLPGLAGVGVGLVCVAVGSGALKTTSQVLLGNLYGREDTRRDSGFSIYYMGVNIGGFLGPILTNAMWGWQGFKWGFGTAAVLMAIGLIQYIAMRKHTIEVAGQEVANPLPRSHYLPVAVGSVVAIVVVVVLFATGVLQLDNLATIVAILTAIIAIALWTQMYRSELVSKAERARLVGFIPMFAASVVFFAVFQQQFTVVALYSDQRLDRTVFGYEIPPGVVQSLNPLFVIVFAGVFAAMWTRLGSKQPSYAGKFSLSLAIIGVAILLFLPFAGGGANSTPFWAIVVILFLFTMAELLLSPVGNSMATLVAPEAFPTRTFSLWMLSVALGTALSGSLSSLYDPSSATAERTYFVATAVVCFALAVVVFGLRKWITREIEQTA